MCMYESICIRMWRIQRKRKKARPAQSEPRRRILLISCTEAPKRFTMPRLTKAHAGGEKRQRRHKRARGEKERNKKKRNDKSVLCLSVRQRDLNGFSGNRGNMYFKGLVDLSPVQQTNSRDTTRCFQVGEAFYKCARE